MPNRTKIAAIALLLALAACGGPRSKTTGALDAGDASCKRSCNRAHASCMDSSAAGRSLGPFSGGETCDRQLRQCMAGCAAAAQSKPEEGSPPMTAP